MSTGSRCTLPAESRARVAGVGPGDNGTMGEKMDDAAASTPTGALVGPGPKPPWLKKRLPSAAAMAGMDRLLRSRRLHTVCEGAACPNRGECFESGTATFLILGDTCTRDCRFCAITGGSPSPLDAEEPKHVAEAAAALGLSHVVITSVTRDDLADGGAAHFAATIREVRRALPGATVEVLIPDFAGAAEALNTVLDEAPEVLNHNVETIPRLYARVRPQADFERSLEVLRRAAAVTTAAGPPSTGDEVGPARECLPASNHPPVVKSGFMVGLGETADEVEALLDRLAETGVDVVTIGQYLRPSSRHLPVVEYVPPQVFAGYASYGEGLGLVVVSGPFVRSSFEAEAAYRQALRRKGWGACS